MYVLIPRHFLFLWRASALLLLVLVVLTLACQQHPFIKAVPDPHAVIVEMLKGCGKYSVPAPPPSKQNKTKQLLLAPCE